MHRINVTGRLAPTATAAPPPAPDAAPPSTAPRSAAVVPRRLRVVHDCLQQRVVAALHPVQPRPGVLVLSPLGAVAVIRPAEHLPDHVAVDVRAARRARVREHGPVDQAGAGRAWPRARLPLSI